MPLFELFSIFALGFIAWLWYDSMQARSIGIDAAQRACRAEDVQLLDDTVSFSRLTLARDYDGHLTIQRTYNFEYSETGNNRCRGSVVLLGHRVLALDIGVRKCQVVRLL